MVNSLVCSFRNPSRERWIVGVLVTVLSGCGRNDVQVYRVAKEQSKLPAQDQAAAMPSGHPDVGAGAPTLKYTLPPGWQETAPGEMRVASFRINGNDGKQADVGVVPLPGLMGRDLENVNRWRSTVGLPAVKQEDLPKLAQAVEVAGQPAQLYEQAGENPGSGEKTRILAAVSRQNGIAWFFKVVGDDELVVQQKAAFVEFLKSVKFAAGGNSAELPPSQPPMAGGLMPLASAAPAPSSGEGKPDWQVPRGWQEIPGGQFLVAKFTVSGPDNAQAAVNVSMAAGDGGGLAGNVNRWRGQLGLGPLSETDLDALVKPVETAGGKASFVELSGNDARTGQKAHLVGAIVPQASHTWFYKLMGNEQVVDTQKDAFTKFVQTVKYPNAP